MPYENLKAILGVNREAAARERDEPPVSCPIDGDILDIRADGTRNCPMGNYTWNGGAKLI